MSVDAGFFLTARGPHAPVGLLDRLVRSRWRPQHEGLWCVAPGDDPGDWILMPSAAAADALLQSKVAAGEMIGVRLWWDGGEVGGEFLIYATGDVIFSPSLNRRKLADGRTSDVSWYLPKIVPVFSGIPGVAVESWSWRETP